MSEATLEEQAQIIVLLFQRIHEAEQRMRAGEREVTIARKEYDDCRLLLARAIANLGPGKNFPAVLSQVMQ